MSCGRAQPEWGGAGRRPEWPGLGVAPPGLVDLDGCDCPRCCATVPWSSPCAPPGGWYWLEQGWGDPGTWVWETVACEFRIWGTPEVATWAMWSSAVLASMGDAQDGWSRSRGALWGARCSSSSLCWEKGVYAQLGGCLAASETGKCSLPARLPPLPILRGGFWDGPFRALSPGTLFGAAARCSALAGIPRPSLYAGKAPRLDPLQQKWLKIAVLTAEAEKHPNMWPLNLPAAEDEVDPPASHASQPPSVLSNPKSLSPIFESPPRCNQSPQDLP